MGPKTGRLWELATLACRFSEEEEEERRRRKGKAAAFLDAASCATSGRKGKGKAAASFLEVGSSSYSTGGAAEVADGVALKKWIFYERRGKKRKAAPEEEHPSRKRGTTTTTTTSSAAKNSRPYKKLETGRPVLMGWVEKAVRMGGTCPRLVVRKQLYDTDVDPYYGGRFPLPSTCPADPSSGGVGLLLDDLSPAETSAVWGAGLPITVLDRWGREYAGAALKLWSDKWYVITGGHAWQRVVASNALNRGDIVEVFRFRVPPRTGDEGRHGRRTEGRLVLAVSVYEASNVEGERGGKQKE